MLTPRYSCSLKVYHSLLPIESTKGIAGLHFLKQNNTNGSFANGLTFCLRFNYKKLGSQSLIWEFGTPEDCLMSLRAVFSATFFYFDRRWLLLKDPIKDTFEIWYANKWQHLCMAYDLANNSLSIIKVRDHTIFKIIFQQMHALYYTILISFKDGQLTNINMTDADLTNATKKVDISDKIYVGRCANSDLNSKCSSHGGAITGNAYLNLNIAAYLAGKFFRVTNLYELVRRKLF